MADWFRSWHGAPTDPKWLGIARRAGVAPGIAVAVAWALMDRASQSSDRGSIAGYDADGLACFFGCETEQVEAIVATMTEKGMIVDGRFASWEKRQPKREDDSSQRVKAHRERKATQSECTVTHCNAPDTDTDTDTEKKKEANASRPNDEVRTAFGLWNELAERRGLPKARDLTDVRRSKLKGRLARNGLDGWREALARLERSSFCLGLKTDWKADLDFVLQEKSFTKLIEGAYGDDAPPSAQPPPIDAERAEREAAERKAYWLAQLAQDSPNEASSPEVDMGRNSPDADAGQLSGCEEREFRREPVGGGGRGGPVQGTDEDGLRPRSEDEAGRGQPTMVSLDAVSSGGRAAGLRGRGAFQPVGGLAGQILAGAGRISPAGE